jgi:propanol-preferring alcohol dehydrogenase
VSDNVEAAVLACAVTKMHGTMVQIAQPDLVSLPYPELIFRDVRVKGSLISSRSEAQRMLDLVAEHNITVKTNPFFGLKEIPRLVELAHSGKMAGKGVVFVEEKEIEKLRAGTARP